jgi:hypothetical protein
VTYLFLRLLLIASCFTSADAAQYAVQLSGSSFEHPFIETGEFVVLPSLSDSLLLENDVFVEHFKQFCLGQIDHQFSNQFFNATNVNGVTYQDVMTQNPAVAQHLSILAQLVLKDVDILEINSPEDSIPAVSFFKKNSKEPFNVYMVWNAGVSAPHPIEFIVRVRVEEE